MKYGWGSENIMGRTRTSAVSEHIFQQDGQVLVVIHVYESNIDMRPNLT